jgi:hypothetical protein
MNNNTYTSLAIIGNGFDLAHKYKTTFTNFTDTLGESFFSDYKEFLSLKCNNVTEWNFFEKKAEELAITLYQMEISGASQGEEINNFNIIFQSIKEKLLNYLQVEITNKPFQKISSIKKCLNEDTIGLNFNYTNIAENYLRNIIYVHGSLDEKEIILGYDPVSPLCLASFENIKWYKGFCRERLTFIRNIKEKFNILNNDTLYLELCDDFEQIQRLTNSGKGFEMEDVSILKHPDYFHEFITTDFNIDVFSYTNNLYENINKIIVLGHSIKSDETYLKEILNKCPCIQQVIIFSYKGEKQEDWNLKADFFRPFCLNIEQTMY